MEGAMTASHLVDAAASQNIVRIGGASAFWGDSAVGPIQLVERTDVNYPVSYTHLTLPTILRV